MPLVWPFHVNESDQIRSDLSSSIVHIVFDLFNNYNKHEETDISVIYSIIWGSFVIVRD